jgi:hypothetical protein
MGTQNSQDTLKQKEQSWRYHRTLLQSILEIQYSKQYGTVIKTGI